MGRTAAGQLGQTGRSHKEVIGLVTKSTFPHYSSHTVHQRLMHTIHIGNIDEYTQRRKHITTYRTHNMIGSMHEHKTRQRARPIPNLSPIDVRPLAESRRPHTRRHRPSCSGTTSPRILGTNGRPSAPTHNVCTPERDDQLCLLRASSASLETRCRGSSEELPLRLPSRTECSQ